jgi:hypothetical protein
MKAKNVNNVMNLTVKFIQGQNELNLINREIEFNNIKETAENLSMKILTTRANLKRFNKKIKGFNFNRKFQIELIINEQSYNLSELFAGDSGEEFFTTLATNEKSFYNFANLIYELLFMATNGGDKLTVTEILSKQNVLLLA